MLQDLIDSSNYPSPGIYYTPTDVSTRWPPGSLGGAFTSGKSSLVV